MESFDLSYRRLELCVHVAFLRNLLRQAREMRERAFLRSFVEGFDKHFFAAVSLHCEQVREAFDLAVVQLWALSEEEGAEGDDSGEFGSNRLPLAS